MLVRVERQADRRDARDAVAFENAEQFALGGLEPGDQRLDRVIGALFFAERGERAAEIIGDRQDIAREFGRRIGVRVGDRSEEHTSELQSLMSISYAVFCLKKKN